MSSEKVDIAHIEDGSSETREIREAAAAYVDPTLKISPEENKRLKRIAFKHLLPVMCLSYITQSLDKGTLQQSSIMGWQAAVGAKGQDYALSSTFLWVGIIFGEPIINQFVRRLPVAKVLGISMFAWSALVFGLAFSLSIPPVFAIRALLGAFESSFTPCLLAITIQWFTVEEQTIIVTIWQAMLGVASFSSNLIAYGFYQMTGNNLVKVRGLYSWQWMTLTVALISTVCAVVVLIFLPDTPMTARFVSEEDKPKLVERVRVNDQGIQQKKWKSDQAREAFLDPLVWLLAFMPFWQSLIVNGINTFNPLLINQAFGFSASQALLLGIPLAAFQVVLYFTIGYAGTRTKQTVLCMTVYAIINIGGTIVLLTVTPSAKTRGGLLVSFYLMQCMQTLNPSIHAMLSRNIAGQTKKSIAYTLFFIGWALGNGVGPQIFQSVWAPRYLNSLYIHLGIYALFLADIYLARYLCVSRNRKRDRAAQGENLHAHAFEDMTDLQNQEFRYSY